MAQEGLSPPSPDMEANLYQALPGIVQNSALNLPAMVRADERLRIPDVKLPNNLENYFLVPLRRLPAVTTDEQQRGQVHHNFYGGYDYDLADHIQTHFHGFLLSRPFIEGPFAIDIGIHRPDKKTGASAAHLCAVGAACLNGTVLRITQLQGVISKGGEPGQEIGPQLGGFRWAAALVKAWQIVADKLGATGIELEVPNDASYKSIYQKAAEIMGIKSAGSHPSIKAGPVPPSPPLPSMAIPGEAGSVGDLRRQLIQIAAELGEGEGSPRAVLMKIRWYMFHVFDLLFDSEEYTKNTSELWNAVGYNEAAMDKLTEAMEYIAAAADIILRYQQKL